MTLTKHLAFAMVLIFPLVAVARADEKSKPDESLQPHPLAQAAAGMQVPEGFHVELFAGEPDIVQPMAMTTDDRGRLWVVECLSYPAWSEKGTDRVVILTDRDQDGRFDSKKVFLANGVNVTSVEVGFGGVWLVSIPKLIFIPDRNADDVPDGPAEVILDGWDIKAKHNVCNGLTWGPDGWLYGLNGILSNSKVGAPGTPEAERTLMNCGVWRVHPTRRTFEVVANGTTNPWGLDFDEYGQGFLTNCVIEHAFHVVQGAHFRRMFGNDFNPHLYGLIESCADHIHWAGGPWQSSRGGQGAHSSAGGGHAHAGAMIYLGDNWPEQYRNHLFTCNIHGNRVNCDSLEQHGSGYVAKHCQDFLQASDSWFRGLELLYGPDGGVWLTDWTDTGECHDYVECDQTNGRIYKITYGKPRPLPKDFDLAEANDTRLVELHTHQNDWYARHARRILQERYTDKPLSAAVKAGLLEILHDNPSVPIQLRAMWTLHACGSLPEPLMAELLGSPSPYVRAWGVVFEVEDAQVSAAMLARLESMSAEDESPVVRLRLASALQRLPLEQRWKIAEGLLGHEQDAQDANLPLMIWYGVEPLVAADRNRAVQFVVKSKIPLVREYLARRLAALTK